MAAGGSFAYWKEDLVIGFAFTVFTRNLGKLQTWERIVDRSSQKLLTLLLPSLTHS